MAAQANTVGTQNKGFLQWASVSLQVTNGSGTESL